MNLHLLKMLISFERPLICEQKILLKKLEKANTMYQDKMLNFIQVYIYMGS